MIGPPGRPVESERRGYPGSAASLPTPYPGSTHRGAVVSKKTKKRKLNARRKKADVAHEVPVVRPVAGHPRAPDPREVAVERAGREAGPPADHRSRPREPGQADPHHHRRPCVHDAPPSATHTVRLSRTERTLRAM